MTQHIRHHLVLALFVCMAIVLGACSPGSTVSAPTPTPAATSTPTPSCATLLPGATAATAPGGYAGLTFPSGTVMNAITAAYGGTGQFKVQKTQLCYHGTPDQVNGPFSGHTSSFAVLFGSGWGVSPTFPADGQTQAACDPGASCFRSGNPPYVEYYLSFENIQTPLSGYVTYQLRLATPPPYPTCNPTYYGPSVAYTYNFDSFNVPPLTKESDFAAGGGHMGGYTYGLCSAGTPATILAFMEASATANGYTLLGVTATNFHVCQAAGGGAFSRWDFTVSTGNEWQINRSSPVFMTANC